MQGGEAVSATLKRESAVNKDRHQPSEFQAVDDAAYATMRQFFIPGLALVFVKDGRVVYQKGFGLTELNSELKTELHHGSPVDSATLFKVGSISKSITALALALLVQEGKVKWNDPLSRHIPELNEANPLVAKLTIRQILSHQTGLDLDQLEPLLWPQPNQFQFENLVAGLNVLGESVKDGNLFKYSNLNYALAGEIVRRASGLSYGEFVQHRIFKPLDMGCIVSDKNSVSRARLAQPHMLIAGAAQMVRPDDEPAGNPVGKPALDVVGKPALDVVGKRADGPAHEGLDAAAGGIRCDAQAMGKWLLFQLSPRTSRLKIADAIWKDIHSGLVVTRTVFDDALRPIEVEAYGLGIQFVVAGDEFRFDHYGGVAGMLAYYAVYPSRGTGFAILMNMNAVAARKLLIERLAGLATSKKLTGSPVHAARAVRALAFSGATVTAIEPGIAALIRTKDLDAKSDEKLLGLYQDAWFGHVSLCRTSNGAAFTSLLSPRFSGRLMLINSTEPESESESESEPKPAPNRMTILWDDQAINSDAVVNVAEIGNARVQRFTLTPMAESDFDFSAMNFQRIGDCP